MRTFRPGSAAAYFAGCTVLERPPASGNTVIPMFSLGQVSPTGERLRVFFTIPPAISDALFTGMILQF
eukprot:11752647-Heterocapsa_arctica.AAC.1